MKEFIPFEIDGTQYQMLYLPVSKSIKVLTRLTKIVSDPMGKAVSAVKMDSGDGLTLLEREIDMALIGQAITALGDRLDESVVWNTILELLSTVEKSNESGGFSKINPELDFQGKPGHLMKVVTKSIHINYSDFLDQVLGDLGKVTQVLRSKEPSTGLSGARSSKK
jgi:hypothetical protein